MVLREHGLMKSTALREKTYSTPEKVPHPPKSCTDLELRELLRPHCRPSKLPAKRVGPNETMLILEGSLRGIHKTDLKIRNIMSYESLCHRVCVHAPRLGIGIGRIDSDLCPICRAWDLSMQPQGTILLKDIHSQLVQKDPDFFVEWDAKCQVEGWTFVGDNKSKPSLDDIRFLDALRDFLVEAQVDETISIVACCGAHQVGVFASEASVILPHWKRRNHTYGQLGKRPFNSPTPKFP